MSMVYKCQFNRLHRSQIEVEACPHCLRALSQPTRERRNAMVEHMLVEEPDDDDISVLDLSSIPSDNAVDGMITTPSSDESDPHPAGAAWQDPEAAYPTPPPSPKNSPESHELIAGSPGRKQRPPSTFAFTVRGISPGPSHVRQEVCLGPSNATRLDFRTSTCFQPQSKESSAQLRTPSPSPSLSPTMAPTKPSKPVKRRTRSTASASTVATTAGGTNILVPQTPQTPLITSPNALPNIVPSIETASEDPQAPHANALPSIVPSMELATRKVSASFGERMRAIDFSAYTREQRIIGEQLARRHRLENDASDGEETAPEETAPEAFQASHTNANPDGLLPVPVDEDEDEDAPSLLNPAGDNNLTLHQLRTTNLLLATQLRDSTALTQHLRKRESIASLQLEAAHKDRDAAVAETVILRAKRHTQSQAWVGKVLKYKALVALGVLYAVYRFALWGAEFEYIGLPTGYLLG